MSIQEALNADVFTLIMPDGEAFNCQGEVNGDSFSFFENEDSGYDGGIVDGDEVHLTIDGEIVETHELNSVWSEGLGGWYVDIG